MKLTIIQKGNPRRAYVVNLKDWMNPDKFVIDAQIPYIGCKVVIRKDHYAIVGIFNENEESMYFVKGGE